MVIYRIKFLFFHIFLYIFLNAEALEYVKTPATGLSFPAEILLDSEEGLTKLHITGVATRTKFFMNIYSMAHYLRHPIYGKKNVIFDQILNDNQTKQINIKWVKDLDVAKMHNSFKESIEKAQAFYHFNVSNETEEFLSYFNDPIQKGDETIFRWFSGGLLEIEFNNEVIGLIESEEFAKTLWSIWFGPKSVVSRNRLISLLKTR
ncbi:MAG: hypothetical protein Tsb0021_00780 [Chlamydiales bacterium]